MPFTSLPLWQTGTFQPNKWSSKDGNDWKGPQMLPLSCFYRLVALVPMPYCSIMQPSCSHHLCLTAASCSHHNVRMLISLMFIIQFVSQRKEMRTCKMDGMQKWLVYSFIACFMFDTIAHACCAWPSNTGARQTRHTLAVHNHCMLLNRHTCDVHNHCMLLNHHTHDVHNHCMLLNQHTRVVHDHILVDASSALRLILPFQPSSPLSFLPDCWAAQSPCRQQYKRR